MFQRDYLLRVIQQAAEAIARAIRALRAKDPEEAEQQLGEGYAALGLDREMLLLLDSQTLQRQLGEDEKIAIAGRLLLADAQLCDARGERKAALRRLSAARRLAALLRAPDDTLDRELALTNRLLARDG